MTNFEGINKGDRVKIETSAGDTAEFTVVFKNNSAIESETNTYNVSDLKSLEVIQNPIPTEPGFYRADNGESCVFMLDRGQQWHVIYTEDLSVSKPSNVFVATWFRNFTRIEL